MHQVAAMETKTSLKTVTAATAVADTVKTVAPTAVPITDNKTVTKFELNDKTVT